MHVSQHRPDPTSDNGIGIPADKLSLVSRLFFQVEQGSTRRYSGLGLGLSVSKSLIEVLGGQFSIRSDGLGKGALAEFTFPYRRIVTPAAAAPSLLNHPPIAPDVEVLLVEDNKVNAAITSRLLKRLGVSRVTKVEDGMAAVEAAREGNFDLIFMDLHLPGVLDGFEAARLIKLMLSSRIRKTHIVALTADVNEDVQKRCEQDMDGYITKPVSVAQLIAALRKASREES